MKGRLVLGELQIRRRISVLSVDYKARLRGCDPDALDLVADLFEGAAGDLNYIAERERARDYERVATARALERAERCGRAVQSRINSSASKKDAVAQTALSLGVDKVVVGRNWERWQTDKLSCQVGSDDDVSQPLSGRLVLSRKQSMGDKLERLMRFCDPDTQERVVELFGALSLEIHRMADTERERRDDRIAAKEKVDALAATGSAVAALVAAGANEAEAVERISKSSGVPIKTVEAWYSDHKRNRPLEERAARDRAAVELSEQGWSDAETAAHLGISRRTVQRALRAQLRGPILGSDGKPRNWPKFVVVG